MPWKNLGKGDWTDANGMAQGTVPVATLMGSRTPCTYEIDVTALAARWVARGENKGALLQAAAGWVKWAGRLSLTPPTLEVITSTGRYTCKGLIAAFSPTSARGIDSRMIAVLSVSQHGIAQFNLSGVRGTVQRAVMKLTATANSSTFVMNVFEADPPRFQMGNADTAPRLGLAALGGEAALKSHPAVIRAGDFSNVNALFDHIPYDPRGVPPQVLPDADAPGTMMLRGQFVPGMHGSFSGRVETMRADTNDPARPPGNVSEEMYCRLYMYLENDWNSTLDANKMAIGWDLRMGYWSDASGGYWQATTGNGGGRGTGLKVPCRLRGRARLWEYQGHSIRMEAGKAPGDGNPYSQLRPLQSYIYNLDQLIDFGDMVRLGNGVISKGRWHCVEQRIKMNSITGPFDELGNGQAVADGELETWLDGVLVSSIKTLRWRRHPEMGIQGPWVNWYFGGRQPADMAMHWRMNHFVVAREYIGPRTMA